MWRNFFIVALRNISKNKIFTLINISGLAIGLASSILILMFVLKELSYDRFHENSDRIHRLYIDGVMGEQTFRGAWTSMVMAPTFTEEIPEIEKFVRFDVFNQRLIWYDGEKYIEDHFMFADSTIFDIFSINFIKGDPTTAFSLSNSVVITEEKARLYFGDRNPLGLQLNVNREGNHYVVTGVIEALPENSHFFADFIAASTTSSALRPSSKVAFSILRSDSRQSIKYFHSIRKASVSSGVSSNIVPSALYITNGEVRSLFSSSLPALKIHSTVPFSHTTLNTFVNGKPGGKPHPA